MKEKQRWEEIRRIAHNQLEEEADLPPPPRIMVDGDRFYVKEVLYDPLLMDKIFPASNGYSPEHFPADEEGTAIEGRSWAIESAVGKNRKHG